MTYSWSLFLSFVMISVSTLQLAACSSTQEMKQQAYATMKSERTYEYEFPVVWKAVEYVLSDYKILEQDPESPNEVELKKLNESEWETDYIYTQSNTRYVEFKVNNLPRKQYLQVRVKYKIEMKRVMGGTHLVVDASEEVEQLDETGRNKGYTSVSDADSEFAHQLLERLEVRLHAQP